MRLLFGVAVMKAHSGSVSWLVFPGKQLYMPIHLRFVNDNNTDSSPLVFNANLYLITYLSLKLSLYFSLSPQPLTSIF